MKHTKQDNNLVSQAEFARLENVTRGAVTHWKTKGQLVFIGKLVDVDASRKLIRQTEDPNRDDVRKRHAINRGEEVEEESNPSFQDSRALKEKYLALQAKVDYEKSMGLLVERAEVERDFIKIATIIRSAFERLPDFLSAELAAETDQDRIRAMLTEEIEAALNQGASKINKIR